MSSTTTVGTPTGRRVTAEGLGFSSEDLTGALIEDQKVSRLRAALDVVTRPARPSAALVLTGAGAWLVLAAVTVLVPDHPDLPLRDAGYIERADPFFIGAAIVVALAWLGLWALTKAPGRAGRWAYEHVAHDAAWVVGAGVFLLFWVFTTAKTLIFAPPYLVAPQEILERMWDSRGTLAASLGSSLGLLAVGFLVGLTAGLLTGVTIGWFQAANYWVHPILVFIGPVPSLAWVPIVFVLFPTSYAGAVFMIALSVWFPITVLTRAGVLGVPRSYFDVAQTLGAKGWFLVLRVSLPAALPSIFTGAFMALGSAFVSLTVAENFGVNAGLGWYLSWKKSWGDFPGLYAGIIVLVLVCGLALTLLFRIRNHVLRWERELTRW
ncbi:ABC transporter permease [Brachybacterium sp. AOP25-B2-12]|uniref:ABC transporter permease n=1 Tax=Brachybacterium sp. AOP25-B2-12 TaxID=3457710 RepID=UPI0040337376